MKIEHDPIGTIDIHTLSLAEPKKLPQEMSEPIVVDFEVTKDDWDGMERKHDGIPTWSQSWLSMGADMRILRNDFVAPTHTGSPQELGYRDFDLNITRELVTYSPSTYSEYFENIAKKATDRTWTRHTPVWEHAQTLKLLDPAQFKEKRSFILSYMQEHKKIVRLREKNSATATKLLAVKIVFPHIAHTFVTDNFTEGVAVELERRRGRKLWKEFASLAATVHLLRAYSIRKGKEGLEVQFEQPLELQKPNPLPILRAF